MRNGFALSATVSLFLSTSPVRALDGYQLLTMCSGDKDSVQYGICIGYLIGIEEQYVVNAINNAVDRLEGETSREVKVEYCYPKTGFGMDERAKVVVEYLRKNTSQRKSNNGTEIVIGAYTDAFPCNG